MKNELIKKLDSLKEEFGDVDGRIILTREAYHACIPDRPRSWKCDAVHLAHGKAITGFIFWHFDAVRDYDEIEDAADLPWEIATSSDFVPDDEIDLTDDDDVTYLLDRLGE